MKKIIYLLILFVLICREWSIIPMGLWSADVHFMLLYGYVLMGFILFRKNKMVLFKRYGKTYYALIIIGILLSVIPAYLYHGQDIVQSLITSRTQLCWLFIPLLFKVSPSEEEILRFAKYATFLIVIVCLLKYININLFVIDDEQKYRMLQGEYPYTAVGYWVSTIPVFIYLQRIKLKQGSFSKNIIVVILCLVVIFLMQNRSTLFPITLLTLYTLIWKAKAKNKFFILCFTSIIVSVVIVFTQNIWLDLFAETTEQVNDSDYARNVEIAYFLSPQANPGFLTYILGNGMISKHTHSWVEMLHEAQIFNSDVGFIGFWNYFGIIPVIIFFITMLMPLVRKDYPYYLKLWGLQMLVCAITISYFAAPIFCFYYSLFFYLLFFKNMLKYNRYVE